MRIAIIPARGGSKRIKGKNIIDFEGRPMISYPLMAVKQSGLFSKIHVSTDNQEIADVVKRLGFPIDFLRPDHLADDHTPVLEVARYVLKTYHEQGISFDSFTMIMACSPLLISDDFLQAQSLFEKNKGAFPVLSVSEFPAPTEWAFSSNTDGTISVEQPELLTIRSQNLKTRYYDTGNFCIQSASNVLNSNSKVLSKFLPYSLPKERAVDIDSLEDLEFAKTLLRAQKLKKA